MAGKPVIPVLSTGQDQLTRAVDQIAYLLRHAYYNPGWTSSYIETYLISLQKLFAECNNNLIDMVGRFKDLLTYSLNNMFDDKYSVTTELYTVNELTKGVRIGIIDKSGNLVLKSDDIKISNGKFYIRSTAGEDENEWTSAPICNRSRAWL